MVNYYLQEVSTSEAINEKISSLFPSWTMILATFLALCLLLIFLINFVYKPIKKNFKKRQEYIQNNIDKAEELKNEAEKELKSSREMLDKNKTKIKNEWAEAQEEIEKIRTEKIKSANSEAKQIVVQAKKDMEVMKKKFEADAKETIANVAVEIAGKIIKKNVDAKFQEQIINKYLNDKEQNE